MSDNKNVNQDKGLQGNEKIEQAIAALQQEATSGMLWKKMWTATEMPLSLPLMEHREPMLTVFWKMP